MSYICKKEFQIKLVDDDGRFTEKSRTIKVGDRYKAVDTPYRVAGGPYTIKLEDKKGRWMELLPKTIEDHFDKRLELSDFVVGEKAYVISKGNIVTVEISKVGRKYVQVKGGWSYYLRDEGDNYLVDNRDWGDQEELFLTRQEAEDEIEFSMLLTTIRRYSEYSRLSKLSLDQLRRIGKIFEEGANGDKEAAASH